ncbi:heptaprenyl diphosphate synthase component II [Listeria sp. PSOL-1]|uniref:heptaprenyl diphosphate synthase component II n=1 Tax=Listeria sp. PSOL-1 TaxID=1844999 RepID=UPI0013D671F7|nr:heptaprenyl diphosphate synthase component II [Listeria sp. PSOL-1]
MNVNFLYVNAQKDIENIERVLTKAVGDTDSDMISEAALHLLKAGGKRIRPLFLCFSSRLSKEADPEEVRYGAAAIELIHMASIVHDDVVDDAAVRRGRPTIKALWGNHIAMYTGDFLFAKSLEYMTRLKDRRAHLMLSKVTVELAIGEIEQIKDKYNFEQSVKTYLRRIKRKTALLIAASCGLGGIIGQLPNRFDEKLYLFGYYVGMAFQISDDILDFVGSEKAIGKPAGEDLRQGNVTLPVFFAMKDPLLAKRIACVTSETNSDEMKRIIQAIIDSGAIKKAEEVATAYSNKALQILNELPQTKELKPLRQVVSALNKRSH